MECRSISIVRAWYGLVLFRGMGLICLLKGTDIGGGQ